ncbi:hypothetical protein BC629DRAFT_1588968 [Irpex lacteus]|nr:hypothetical protein BC629DRAFT_1588968 [Irpex lacteus]
MALTFSPALQTTTALPVAPTGRASFRFSASFSSHDEYNRAHREGSRLEIWTNLPVGDHSGSDWHALAFSYPEDSAAETAANDKVFTLTPTTPEVANKADNATVVLDLTLSNARPGAVYSFTYRLVHASGAIEWLGAYGQNGDLVVEEKDVRFTLAQGSTLEHGAIVNADLNTDIDAVTLGTLNKSVDWVSWGFSEDGCKASYSGLSVPPSSAVLLMPRPTDTRLVDVQPLLLKAYGGAVSVTSNGDLVRHNGLAVLDVSETFTEATVLPGSSIISIQNGFAVVASPGKDSQDVPTSLSFIPISREAWTTPSTEIRLTEANIRSILDSSEHTDAVIVDSSVSTFATWKAGEDLVVRVSAPGAQCVIAPVYSLPTAKEDESVSLALITTSASARVEVVEGLQGSALLTPPPSPPAFIRPITTPAQAVPEPEVVPEATEQLEESKAPEVEATSEAQAQAEDAVVDPVEEDHAPDQKPETPTIPTALIPLVNKPIGASFFRFVLAFVAWLARPVLDKLYSFFGSNVLLLLACKIFGTGQPEPTFSTASPSEQEVVEVPDELVDGETEPQSPQAGSPIESKESDIPQREKALLRTYSELTVSDGSTMICEAEEEEVQVTEEKIVHTVLSKVVEDVTPPPQAPTRLQIPQRKPLTITKSHLAVDARSEVISLLASIKSKDAALPELEVIINGERSRQPLKSSQVAEGVYLVELRLPSSDSAKLQVAVRQ